VTLELGGKCPCLVCADAPLDLTARRIVWGKFLNAGQTCVAPDFVLADHRIHDRLVSALAQAIQDFYGEDPQRSPHYGRIVNRRHFDRLTGYLDSGQIAHGGQRDAAGLYLAPTLLTGVSWEIPVMREEIFGPHLPFGGFGESGLGAYHGQASFDCFTHYRTVLRRSLAYDARLRYPPTRLALATLKRAFRFLVNK
jgi:aldehyde dehydrogenase (NAD+)